MSHRRKEPAELCELRKQVVEVKEGLLELRRKEGKEPAGSKEIGKGAGAPERMCLGKEGAGEMHRHKGVGERASTPQNGWVI